MKWQGWLVVFIGIAFVGFGVYVGELDDAPGAAALGVLLMLVLVFVFGYWKGEKPRWPASTLRSEASSGDRRRKENRLTDRCKID